MEEFRQQVRMQVTAARGIVDAALVSGTGAEDLDRAISKLAVVCLTRRAQMTTFYFAFDCQQTWEAIQLLYHAKLHKEVDVDSLRKYAREAVKALAAAAAGPAPSLTAWEAGYRQRG